MSLNQQPKFPRINWEWTKSTVAKKMFNISRFLHVYLSVTIFGLLVFFSLTGFTLNHSDWFKSENEQTTAKYSMPAHITQALKNNTDIPSSLLQQYVKQEWGLTNPRKINLDVESGHVLMEYAHPSGKAHITAIPEQQTFTVTYSHNNIITLLGTLHKGKRVGATWSLLIDLTSLIVFLFAITGLYILFQNRRYRTAGLPLALLGMITPFLIYFLLVPRF